MRMTERTTYEFDEEANRRLYEEIAQQFFNQDHNDNKQSYPNTLDKRVTAGSNPERNQTDGLYPFFARFATGEQRPAHASAATYKQESHPQDEDHNEWHRANYTLEDGREVNVMASVTRDGDFLINVHTNRPDGRSESAALSSNGIEWASPAHPFADGSTFASFNYGENRDDPRYTEAMRQVGEIASDLLFG